jgi:hypothetical protein
MPSKEEEARRAAQEAKERDDNANDLPVYSTMPSQGPTANSPFDFPSEGPPPAFASIASSASSQNQPRRSIAIPQITPNKTEPFLDAYSQQLLQYGITPESWRAFLATISAFLAAKVSEQAVSHAADIGRHVTNVPKRFGLSTVEHAKAVGHDIRDSAKNGNYIGAAMAVVRGAIALPVVTAVNAVGATISLPFTAINAATQRPQTPRDRAAAYAAATNKKWLGVRGLKAQLVDTVELARTVGLPVSGLLNLAGAARDRGAVAQIGALNDYINELEAFPESTLDLGANTLWLVVLEVGAGVAVPAPDVKAQGRR